MENLIKFAVRIALVLAAMGQLKTATLFFMKESAKTARMGLPSLSVLNRQLLGPPEHSARPLRRERQ